MTRRFSFTSMAAALLMLTAAPLCQANDPSEAEELSPPDNIEIDASGSVHWLVYHAEEDGALVAFTHNSAEDLVIEIYGEDIEAEVLGHFDGDHNGHAGNEMAGISLAEGEVAYIKIRTFADGASLPDSFSLASYFLEGAPYFPESRPFEPGFEFPEGFNPEEFEGGLDLEDLRQEIHPNFGG